MAKALLPHLPRNQPVVVKVAKVVKAVVKESTGGGDGEGEGQREERVLDLDHVERRADVAGQRVLHLHENICRRAARSAPAVSFARPKPALSRPAGG